VSDIASTPEPPYVAVIFTSRRTDVDDGYAGMSEAMEAMARRQDGFLGVESARDGLGITVSYWRDEAAARAWKDVAAHLVAQRRGREVWYSDYRVRVATVTRAYGPAGAAPASDTMAASDAADSPPMGERATRSTTPP
jgi:heme-degrading monooxygenase HmoA